MAEQDEEISIPGEVLDEEAPGTAPQGEGIGSEIGDFMWSTWSAMTNEMVGGEPLQGVQEFREESPIGGTASQFLGAGSAFLAPELAPLRAFRLLPGGRRAVSAVEGSRKTSPVLSEVGEQAIRFGGFEAGRTGVAGALHGAEAAKETAWEGLMNIGIAGLIGGGFRSVRESSPGVKADLSTQRQVQQLDPDFDLNASEQEKLRRMLSMERAGGLSEDMQGKVRGEIGRLKKAVRAAEPQEGEPYVRPLQVGGKAQELNRRFRVGDYKGLQVRALNKSKKGFDRLERVQDILGRAGFPDDWEGFAQFGRYVRTSSRSAAKNFQETLRRNLEHTGDGIWIGREADDGLFVMARKIRGKVDQPAGDDEFVMWKTDKPAAFTEKARSFGAAEATAMRARRADPMEETREAVPLARFSEQLDDLAPSTSAMVEDRRQPSEWGRKFVRGLFGEEGLQKYEEAVTGTTGTIDYAKRWGKRYFSPALTEVAESPRGARILGKARSLYDRAQAEASKIIYGKQASKYGDNLFKDIFATGQRTGGLDELIEEMDDAALRDISKMRVARMSPDAAEEAGFSAQAVKVARQLQRVDEELANELTNVQALTGRGNFVPSENHYLISRSWQGDRRMPMYDQRGKKVAVASGASPKKVIERAEEIKKFAKQEDDIDLHYDKDDIFRTDPEDDLELAASMDPAAVDLETKWHRAAYDLPRFQEEHNVLGAMGDIEPISKKDLRQIIEGNVRASKRYMADSLVRHDMGEEMAKLAQEDPDILEKVAWRINRMAGEKGAFSAYLEKQADQILSPTLGVKSQQVTQVTNQALFHWYLGFGDVGFGALNALTPGQTVLPEIAYTLSTPPAALSKYYGVALVGTERRVQEMRFADPIRVMKQAFKEMKKPDEKAWADFQRAADEGVWAPRLVEEVVGEQSQIFKDLRKVASGEQGMVTWLRELSQVIPAKTEEFGRAVAFMSGRVVGRDFYGFEGERLYQFAKNLTDRSMFRYANSDRARIITGAYGGMFGLFKNWMMHYMANMANYTSEGFYHGNWAPFLWQQAGTFSIGGLGGMAGVGMLNNMNEAFQDESLMESLYSWWGYEDELKEYTGDGVPEQMADFVYYGLPGFFNISLQGRAAVPGSDVPQDLSQLFNVVLWERLVAAGDTVNASVDAWQMTGQHPASDPKVKDALMRFAAPRTLQRAMQTTEDGGLRSLKTGNKLISGMSTSEQALQMMGLQSTDVAKAYEASSILWQEKAEMRQLVTNYGSRVADARMNGDWETVSRLYKRAQAEGVDLSSVMRSAEKHVQNEQNDALQRNFDEFKAQRLEETFGIK